MNTDIEHVALRQEIVESGTHAINAANIVVTITGVALVAAFEFEIPLVALLPLMPLYYSYKIAFNSTQTIARTGAYLNIVEDERYEKYLSRLRQMTHDEDELRRKNTWWVKRIFTAHSSLREVWISPILQRLFVWLGAFCIGVAAWAALSAWGAPASLPSFDQLFSVAWSTSFNYTAVGTWIAVFVAGFLWLVFAIRQQVRFGDPLYGPTSMMRQFEGAWAKVVLDDADRQRTTENSATDE